MNGESLVSKNSVEIYLRESQMRVSSELVMQLDGKVKEVLDAAVKRAEQNGRSTVKAQDL